MSGEKKKKKWAYQILHNMNISSKTKRINGALNPYKHKIDRIDSGYVCFDCRWHLSL